MVTEAKERPQLIATALLGKILKTWHSGKRHLWLEGGTWASKTWSVMQFLKLLAENTKDPLHISVTSETLPHLKRGAMLDFKNIMGQDFDDRAWNKTDFIYRWPVSGSWMEFVGADVPSKFTGGRRDILFVNEANHVGYDTFRQADMRTRLFTIADWNPESEFWFHENECHKDENEEFVLNDRQDGEYIKTTYLDALEVLPRQQQKDIEKFEETDPNWWRIYGLGLLGKITGLVYPQFEQVDELPDAPRFYGLDFGSLVDPTVLTANVLVGDKLYSQELFYIYDAEITNNKISMEMQLLKVSRQAPIYPDPDEPKSAVELRQLGWTIGDTVKGKGSVVFGRKAVNNFYQHWTKDSLNCIKEQRNFRFIVDREGNLTEKTTHRWSHGMDSRRYAVASHTPAVSVRNTKRSNTW